jgi:hypothetical protein
MKTTLQILQEARELISVPERWTQGSYARNAVGSFADSASDEAVCFCSAGALCRVGGAALDTINAAGRALSEAIGGGPFIDFNDRSSHPQVLARFDRAIVAEQAKESA